MRALAWVLLLVPLSAAMAQERAPFVVTPSDVVEHMLRLAGTGASDLVVDLGSGDGRIVIDAAREFGARGLGIELDPALVEKSRENARLANVADRVSFVQGDVLFSDISQASVVTVYLLPGLIRRLQPRFLGELKPGTRIVSHAFYMTSWKPDRVEKLRVAAPHELQGDESTIYLWIVPADARGTWEGGGWQLRISQNFQEIDVDARRKGAAVAVTGARLSGRDIVWEAAGKRFTGRVGASHIRGELSAVGGTESLVLAKRP